MVVTVHLRMQSLARRGQAPPCPGLWSGVASLCSCLDSATTTFAPRTHHEHCDALHRFATFCGRTVVERAGGGRVGVGPLHRLRLQEVVDQRGEPAWRLQLPLGRAAGR